MATKTKTTEISPVKSLNEFGFRSEWAYTAGFLSIALALISWLTSQAKNAEDKAQSDRWGIFIGHWAPTFFGLGVALHLYENKK